MSRSKRHGLQFDQVYVQAIDDEGSRVLRLKLPLRSKFYLLVLPSAIILVAMMVLLMLPHGEIEANVDQIDQGLAEVLAAEGFARHYEHQLRECAAFIATGSPEHERLFEQARQSAQVEIGAWIKAEQGHDEEPREENEEELEKLATTKDLYAEITAACDWAIALARSGRTLEAIQHLDTTADSAAGADMQENIDQHIGEEEAQLNRYLDNLEGAVGSLSVMRLMGMQGTVKSMRGHVASMVFTEQFARYYNEQAKESIEYLVTGDPADEEQLKEAGKNARAALESWVEQAARISEKAVRENAVAFVDRIEKRYAEVNAAWAESMRSLRSGEAPQTVIFIEGTFGPDLQTTLTTTMNKEIAIQNKAVLDDASHITSTSQNTGWGVGLIGALLLLVAIGGTLYVSRMVVAPVVQLKDAATRFGQGGGDINVDVKTHDELSDLADSFNEMAAARVKAEAELREARDELERRVEERTAELARLNEELLSTNKELRDFAYVISHDLKAPLRGIGSLASWLSTDYGDVLDEEGRKQLGLLLDRAKRMESLIESILEYSRLGRIRDSVETVDANELVRSAIVMVSPPPTVSVTTLGRLPRIRCERARMQQVFQNLIDNAVKFTDKPIGIVTISCRDAGSNWEFAVADNGPGIDPRYFEQIFQIFQTLGTADDKSSTGIGLTLVKRIVELHGGKVWVESEKGSGSTFLFTLPKKQE